MFGISLKKKKGVRNVESERSTNYSEPIRGIFSILHTFMRQTLRRTDEREQKPESVDSPPPPISFSLISPAPHQTEIKSGSNCTHIFNDLRLEAIYNAGASTASHSTPETLLLPDLSPSTGFISERELFLFSFPNQLRNSLIKKCFFFCLIYFNPYIL